MNELEHKTISPNHTFLGTIFQPLFTGKEKDSETGYYYFGARYYNPDLSLWLSVDPMADKYPSLSPYNYCAWNPMKLVDPNGMETIDNDDGWIVDKLNKTITRVRLDGDDRVQFVEGDGDWRREESRTDLLEQYKDYMFIDNVQPEACLNSSDNKSKSNDVPLETVAGTIVGGASLGCNNMSKTIFDYKNGTYMGKDGSIKPIRRGKNGGLNGKYKSQIELSVKYGKAASGLRWIGHGMAAWSAWETEKQARNGEISTSERVTNHIVNGVSFLPYCWHVPIFYELGKKHGPSSW